MLFRSGESALKLHMKAEKHKVNIQQLQTKSMVTISSFFKKSTGDDLKEKETVPLVAADMAIPHPPANLNMTVSKSALLESYVTKDDNDDDQVCYLNSRVGGTKHSVTSCIYFHCFFAIQFCSASVFMKSCERCLNLLCIRSFDVSRMFAARYDVVQ